MTKIERELLMALAAAMQIGRPNIKALIVKADEEAKPKPQAKPNARPEPEFSEPKE